MELVILDAEFEPILTFDDFETLIWVRRYYEPGTFEVHCGDEYFADLRAGVYLYCAQMPELGVLEKVRYEREGHTLIATGRFAECLLERRVLTVQDTAARTPEEWTRQWLQTCVLTPADAARALPLLLAPALGGGTPVTADDVRGKTLLESACALLKLEEKGLRVRFDPSAKTLTAAVWQGCDRTGAQSTNTLAVFSEADETANTESWERDAAPLRNFAYVTDGKTPETLVTVDRTAGADRRELWVSASVQRESGETNAAYAARLAQQGALALDEASASENVDLGVAPGETLVYGTDWDLGELVEYADAARGLHFTARVEAVTVTAENGCVTAVPSLGNDKYL